MSQYDIEASLHRLHELGVDTSELHQNYYQIPLENIELKKIEKEAPTKTKLTSKHTIIIDSRQRNYSIYPDPNNYLIELTDTYKNVERIELIAAMLPKTEYNINSENNLLLVTIGSTQEQLLLSEGQYTVGSNVAGSPYFLADGSSPNVFGLIAELQRVLNTHTLSGNDFNVFLATVPSTVGTGNNASVLNRIVITNSTVSFSIDFINATFTSGSPFRVLGFLKQVYTSNTNNIIYGSSDTGLCTSSDLAAATQHTITIPCICGIFDYDLLDDPNYIIMQLEFGNKSADRIKSADIATNQKFAVIIYDNNDSDVIATYNSNASGNVQTQFVRPPARLKALKGQDFDKKIVVFDPPFTLENFKISFFKYDNSFYQFHNREHALVFEIDVADYDPKYRY